MASIDEAVRAAGIGWPYYRTALGGLRLVPDESVPTMATSAQWTTHYNPAALDGWTAQEAGAVLVHELEHLLRRHHERCGERDPQGWNVASDAEINQRLQGLPDGAIYPATLGMPNGQPAEVYYAASGQDGKPQPQPQDGSGQDGAGQPGSGQPQPGDGAGQPGSGQPQPGAGAPSCGSCAGGPTQPQELGDQPGDGAANPDAYRKNAAESIMQGIGCGAADADELRAWAERELGIDRAAWYRALSGAVGRVLAPYGAPTRWQWPGRRDMRDMGGAMLPRWSGERPSCAVVIDTSSSITPTDLEMGAAAGLFLGRTADVTYYTCDTRPVRLGANLPDTLGGGGGTDLRNGIAMAISEGARAVVVITDCMTPWPDEPCTVPIIVGANPASVAVYDNGWASQYRPPEWITVLPLVPRD